MYHVWRMIRYIAKRGRCPTTSRAVLVIPNKTISTAKSRTILPDTYKKEEVVYSLSHSSLLTALFMSESWELLKIASKDRLHQTRRMKQMPELFEVQEDSSWEWSLNEYAIWKWLNIFTLCYGDDASKIHKKTWGRSP